MSNLDSSLLKNIPNNKLISWEFKDELIHKLDILFIQLKDRNIKSLKYQVSKCKSCYPDAPVYTFFDSESDYVVGRYVITETQDQYIFEQCKNTPIEDDAIGMPF